MERRSEALPHTCRDRLLVLYVNFIGGRGSALPHLNMYVSKYDSLYNPNFNQNKANKKKMFLIFLCIMLVNTGINHIVSIVWYHYKDDTLVGL